MEKTTIKISKQTSKQLAEIINWLRVFASKKDFIESLVESFYTTLKRFKEQGAIFILLGSPKLTKEGLLFPIKALNNVVFGVIPCRMNISEEEADFIVDREIKKKFEEMSQNE
ncbi:hypothetical protein DRO91_03825 [Candidatus Heimdallarchaeota archaeon]|nr:MAG: hypothetical protein DRO91_03825 [Candidatus Heimdallarchaeota archaeon]